MGGMAFVHQVAPYTLRSRRQTWTARYETSISGGSPCGSDLHLGDTAKSPSRFPQLAACQLEKNVLERAPPQEALLDVEILGDEAMHLLASVGVGVDAVRQNLHVDAV